MPSERSEPNVQIIRVEAAPSQQVDIAGLLEAARSPATDLTPFIEAMRANRPEPSQVRFEEGAFHVEVHAPEPGQFTMQEGAVRVEAPRSEPESVELEYDDEGRVVRVTTV
jgi:hypothetical protein